MLANLCCAAALALHGAEVERISFAGIEARDRSGDFVVQLDFAARRYSANEFRSHELSAIVSVTIAFDAFFASPELAIKPPAAELRRIDLCMALREEPDLESAVARRASLERRRALGCDRGGR